jgi:hypothetical protein
MVFVTWNFIRFIFSFAICVFWNGPCVGYPFSEVTRSRSHITPRCLFLDGTRWHKHITYNIQDGTGRHKQGGGLVYVEQMSYKSPPGQHLWVQKPHPSCVYMMGNCILFVRFRGTSPGPPINNSFGILIAPADICLSRVSNQWPLDQSCNAHAMSYRSLLYV